MTAYKHLNYPQPTGVFLFIPLNMNYVPNMVHLSHHWSADLESKPCKPDLNQILVSLLFLLQPTYNIFERYLPPDEVAPGVADGTSNSECILRPTTPCKVSMRAKIRERRKCLEIKPEPVECGDNATRGNGGFLLQIESLPVTKKANDPIAAASARLSLMKSSSKMITGWHPSHESLKGGLYSSAVLKNSVSRAGRGQTTQPSNKARL